jgi:hypothetical protein
VLNHIRKLASSFARKFGVSWQMERVMGIEPTLSAWEAEVLPLNYTRLRYLQWFGLQGDCRLQLSYAAHILL